MTNPYYTRAFNALAGSLARARQMINEFELIRTGFDGVDAKIAIALGDLAGALDYSPSTAYIVDNYVRYLGAVYRAKGPTTGNLPTNTTYWQRVDIGAKDLTLIGQTTGIALRASALIFRISAGGANSPASITLTAYLHPALAGPASFSVISGTATLTGTGNSRTLTYANMTTDIVTIRATVTDGSGTYTDDVTLYKVRDGLDGADGANGADGAPAPTSLNASNLVAGTVPDARFPSTLPSGVTVPAAQLSGNIAQARLATALNASGSAGLYAARAWCSFNGTGTPALIGTPGGVTSTITDNGVGDFTINFLPSLPNTDYAVHITTNSSTVERTVGNVHASSIGGAPTNKTTGQLRMTFGGESTKVDPALVMVTVVC